MNVTLGYFMLVVGVLVSVAFLTLLERKILGYIQLRKGPNKVGYVGFMQPFSDAVKLFTKESNVLSYYNYVLFYLSPVFTLFLMLVGWMMVPLEWGLMDFSMGILFMLCLMSVGVYGMLGAGWSSNSKYSLLGGMRSIAQTISYEVSFSMVIISLVILVLSFDVSCFDYYGFVMVLFFPIFLCWVVSVLAELNRTPFDFAEGESELVSGFNVEYSGVSFALIFMAEYGSIIFLSFISVVMFMGGWGMVMKGVLFSLFIIMIRGSYPRFRYDKLMNLAWKGMLPVILFLMLFMYGMSMYIM